MLKYIHKGFKLDDFEGFFKKISTTGNYGLQFVNNCSKNSIKVYQYNLVFRKKQGYKFTDDQEFKTRITYSLVDYIFRGDQWSVISDQLMRNFHKQGFLVECFGSPLNTRSKYFGSFLSSDKLYGSLGTAQYILNTLIEKKPLMYGKTVIYGPGDLPCIFLSMPSGYELQNSIIDMVLKLLSTRKCKIYIGMSSNIYKYRKDDLDKYTSYADYHVDMYEVQGGKFIFTKKLDKGWYNVMLIN